MANSYGFDFLRSEHTLDADGQPRADESLVDGAAASSSDAVGSQWALTADIQAAKNKPDLEKQFDILAFLQAHRGSGCLSNAVIYRATGIDLDIDVKVAEMLQRNPKVRVEMVPDFENPAVMAATYAYQAKYNTVKDRTTLLAQINRMTSGVSMRDLLDSYQTVQDDLAALITAGDIIAVVNTEDKDKILFPRGEAFLVELDGIVALPPHAAAAAAAHHQHSKNGTAANGSGRNGPSPPAPGHGLPLPYSNGSMAPPPNSRAPPPPEVYVVDTDVDPTRQIRRGEAVCVGGQWFRVSSAVKEGVPLSEQPSRAQAPVSVVSLTDLSKRNEVDGYIRPFGEKLLPLDASLTHRAQENLTQSKLARERLNKLAHGRGGGGGSGGLVGQLLGNHAHAKNPVTLAQSFASGAALGGSHHRKRPAAVFSKHGGGAGGGGNHPHGVSAGSFAAAAHPVVEVSKEDLEKAAANPFISLYSHARRHGCTRDVREMYLQTRSLVPEADEDLRKLLLENKLLDPSEQMRRPRLAKSANVDNDGKPKKRRYYERKNQRMTNTHLEGTDIGAILARATETQKQGKSVGDGGM